MLFLFLLDRSNNKFDLDSPHIHFLTLSSNKQNKFKYHHWKVQLKLGILEELDIIGLCEFKSAIQVETGMRLIITEKRKQT